MPQWEIKSRDLVHWVEVKLNNDQVRVEAGAMRYYQGPISMKSRMPSVSGFFKARLTGEKVFRPVYAGTGRLVLEPSFKQFYKLDLEDDTYILERGAYWASDMSVDVTMKMNKLSTSFFSGEGLLQTAVRGSGSVLIKTPGEVEVIDLQNDRLVVDGAFAVARSASLDFSVQQSTRSLLGTVTSGEILVTVLQGTGRVYLAPIPNHTLLLQQVIQSSIFPATSGGAR